MRKGEKGLFKRIVWGSDLEHALTRKNSKREDSFRSCWEGMLGVSILREGRNKSLGTIRLKKNTLLVL